MKNWKNEYATEKDKEMKKNVVRQRKRQQRALELNEALSHVIPLSKVVKEGQEREINNLYGTWCCGKRLR